MYAQPRPFVARYPGRDAIERWLIAHLGITVDGTTIPESDGNITIDGTNVTEVTVDGTAVWNADAIPTNGLLHQYDFTKASGTATVEDQHGNDDLTGAYTGPSGTINGLQAGVFDGSNDLLDVSYSDSTQPLERFAVVKMGSLTSSNKVIVDGDSALVHTPYVNSSDEWTIFAGSTVNSGTAADTNPHLLTTRIDGASSLLRLDGTQIASGNAGSNEPGGMTVGAREDDVQHADVVIGEIADYDPNAAGYSRSDVESYFTDRWGPF